MLGTRTENTSTSGIAFFTPFNPNATIKGLHNEEETIPYQPVFPTIEREEDFPYKSASPRIHTLYL